MTTPLPDRDLEIAARIRHLVIPTRSIEFERALAERDPMLAKNLTRSVARELRVDELREVLLQTIRTVERCSEDLNQLKLASAARTILAETEPTP